MDIPITAYDLILELNKRYPEKCPSISDTERSIWMYAGKRHLINELLNSLKQLEKHNPRSALKYGLNSSINKGEEEYS